MEADKTMTSIPQNESAQSQEENLLDCTKQAAFIVGCLVHQGFMPITLDSQQGRDDYALAVRLTARCLHDLLNTESGNHIELPFRY